MELLMVAILAYVSRRAASARSELGFRVRSMENSRRSNRGIEENTLAILDSSGFKDARDVNDDRLAFLDAVRASSIVPEIGTAPTSKMLSAIFQILKDGTSLELIMESYQLLIELEKVINYSFVALCFLSLAFKSY
ncbi:PREDICTED: uncharacterized protein LOC104591497 isoform X3 [Nelumbo nucifera]|uniref:Uncharacterized protein LOC104591497 isoform X3 n=1 Tax=Nelumbo nucifera TaxID=4432 RepID=A0A1U7ZJY6_NELNU|nr:PREDICTED: uncharacterized protein LOC104591497 isoform X3 [Nelumbo nucifera]